jgi:hypothetical protein
MLRTFLLLVDIVPTRGGRIVVSFVVFLVGLSAEAIGLDVGHDIAVGALGVLIGLLHYERPAEPCGFKTPS